MVYQGKLVLKKVESAEIDQLLNACSGRKEGNDACGENCPVKEIQDCVIFHIVSFLNGKSMDIRAVFGCPPWTEAVLLAEDEEELRRTEPGEEFFGQWVLDYAGDIYQVQVIREGGDLDG